jgi:hypothetical protein
MDLELKFRGRPQDEFQYKFTGNSCNFDFNEVWPASSLLHLIAKKNHFLVKEDQKVEFHSKG